MRSWCWHICTSYGCSFWLSSRSGFWRCYQTCVNWWCTCLESSWLSRSIGFLILPGTEWDSNLLFRSIFDWHSTCLADWTIVLGIASHFCWRCHSGFSFLWRWCSSGLCCIFKPVKLRCCPPEWDEWYVVGPFVVSVCHLINIEYKCLKIGTFYFWLASDHFLIKTPIKLSLQFGCMKQYKRIGKAASYTYKWSTFG